MFLWSLVITLAIAAPEPATARGERMIEAYFRRQTQQIADACLADVKTRDDWEKKRPELRRQFLEMLGLWPLPPRTDLNAVVTGKIESEHFTIEKLHFQSSPGLYVTANLYVPKNAKLPAPTVLYVCGHANTVIDKVSYGSKVNYQRHPAWFAEHGYVCLILDTLELSEIPGEHHGTSRKNMWWWHDLGYTPAGIECWNAMRALDYLETRREVDPKRLGVTGRSGGGATSWWLAAADERPQCIIPVAGIADLKAHVVEGTAERYKKGVILGHCDCMYHVNTYRWDFPMVAALCAPRPLMLGNSDADEIFPEIGYRGLAMKVKQIYELYGAADRFTLLETKGPHKDTPELRTGAFRWMNRWLKGDTSPVTDDEPPTFTPQQLKVLQRTPDDARNATIQESFLRPAQHVLPSAPEVAREWWNGKRKEWMEELQAKVFHGWPDQAPPLNVRLAGDVKHDGVRLRAYDFTSEAAIDLRLWLLTAEKVEKPKLIVLSAVDEAGWQEWLRDLGPDFKAVLQTDTDFKRDDAKFDQNRRALEHNEWAFATIAPRGIGPTRWAEPGSSADVQIRRRFPLIGQTLDGQRVWDIRRAVTVPKSQTEWKETPLWLSGRGEMAALALYAALFEPEVARIDLWHPPPHHRDKAHLLNILRVLDMPQAMTLAFPRPIRVYVKDEAAARSWDWPLHLQKALGHEYLKIQQVGE